MELYWKEHKLGLRLMLLGDDKETEVGLIRRTPRGFDAMATTAGYNPGRALKDIKDIKEARSFVESFSPWTEFGGAEELVVDSEVRPK